MKILPLAGAALLLGVASLSAQTAQVRHAPTLNGTVEGSVQQMLPESLTLNGGAVVTLDLLVPGSPAVRLNGQPNYGGTLDGTGAATPSNHQITLNGSARLRHVVRRTDALTLPTVAAPAAPTGTVTVTVSAADPVIAWSTLRHLTLNGGVGQVAVPPGAYGDFTANGGSGFTLGVAGSTQPSVYHFQRLTLNGATQVQVVGPVIVNLANGFSANGTMGAAGNPGWLALNLAGGGLTLNGGATFNGFVLAPNGTVVVSGNSVLVGGVASDRLTVNGGGILRLQSAQTPNQPPTVALVSPASGATFTAPGAFTLAATAADPDGAVARVEFFQGGTLLGTDNAAPYEFAVSGLGAGSYTFTARATDNGGASVDSAPVSVTVAMPNQPPTVALTAPADGASFTAPAAFALTATASDSDGTVARVEFYQGALKLGEDSVAPYEFSVTGLTAGTYAFSARALDNAGAAATAPTVTVTVLNPNVPPTVAMTAPVDGATYVAPAAFTLAATASDSDGTIAKVEFYRDGTLLGTDTAAPYEFAVSALGVGTFHFLARATDNSGSSSDSSSVAVSVAGPNQPPTVTLTTPADGATFPAGTTLRLEATATDADGTVAQVDFYDGSTLLATDTAAPFAFDWANAPSGPHSLTARATDNQGATAVSPVRTITVLAAPASLPFLAGFETAEGYVLGPLNGQQGWSASSNSVVTDADFATGARSALVPGGDPPLSLSRSFSPHPSAPVVFLDYHGLPFAASGETLSVQFATTDATRLAFVKVAGSGRIAAFHGDGAGSGAWQTLPGPVALDGAGFAADWIRLTARVDFAAHKWDFYLNGRLAAYDLGFARTTQSGLGAFTLTGHASAPTLLDDFLAAGTNPLFADADRDGMDDAWETTHGLNPALNDRDDDSDGDGLSNILEFVLGTDPVSADTDADGLPDGWERQYDLNPLVNDANGDPDGDGVANRVEYLQGRNPARGAVPDSNGMINLRVFLPRD